jgi:hypothetical protein
VRHDIVEAKTGWFDAVAVIYRWGRRYGLTSPNSSGDRELISIYDSCQTDVTDADVRRKWREFRRNAESYPWAEQAVKPSREVNASDPVFLKQWPNSKYEANGTNSNVFVREMVKEAGLKMIEHSRSHPPSASRNASANEVPGSWIGTPWHAGSPTPPIPVE